MKRFLSLFLVIVMLCCMMPTAFAASDEATAAADELYALGLFNGTGTDANGKPIYDLDRAPTRHEAVTMLVRLLGKGEEALAGTWKTPFTDVAEWAKPYVGYAYDHGLTSGTSATTYSGNEIVTASQYLTFILRALGYDSSVDFQWNKAWELSDAIGLTFGEYNAETTSFTRGDVAIISASALKQKLKGTEKTLENYIREQMKPTVDFSALLEEFSAKHKNLVEAKGAFDDFEDYLVEDMSAANLLTAAEITSLLKENPWRSSISYAEAVEDVDLLFRAFKSAYGAYYYFGEKTFDAAQSKIMDWLAERTTVNYDEFGTALADAFSFLRDAHASVADRTYERDIRYEYFYCIDQNFLKDANGYYKMINGQKWYFKSFSDPRVRMEYTLTLAGEIVYAPVLFCTAAEMKNSAVILQNAAGETITQPLNWKLSEDSDKDNYEADFTLLQEQGIAYLSILNFQSRCEEDMIEFVASGKTLKDAELIIFDLRSNGGGNGRYSEDWVKNFCGTTPVVPLAYSTRFSSLQSENNRQNGRQGRLGTYGTFECEYQSGKYLRNDVPIIVLVDDVCGSAGESALNYLRSMENVLVVGSNSAGYQLCGDAIDISLPSSGLTAQFGTTFRFHFTSGNVDFKGYEPDVWCNPKTAVEAVLNMLLRYDQMNVSTWYSLRDSLAEDVDADLSLREDLTDITLLFSNGFLVQEESKFRTGRGDWQITVQADDCAIDNYTAKSSDPSICDVRVESNGILILTPKQSGSCTLYITYQGQTAEFYYQSAF